MKTKMMLVEIDTKDKLKGTSETYIFIPTLKELREYVDFRVKGPIAGDVLHTLGLPVKKGDTIVVEVLLKGEQSELPGEGENGKKKGRSASED